ncbi:hypothetical protein BGZ59_011272, partial [Podila verticillata]
GNNPYPTGYPTGYPTSASPPGPTNTGSDNKSSSNVGLYAGIGGGVAAVILIAGLFFYFRRKKPSNSKVDYAAVPAVPTSMPQPTPSPKFTPTTYQPEAVASINNAQIYHANTSDYQNQQQVPLPGQNYAQSSVYSPTIATNISSPTVVSEQNVVKPVEASPAKAHQDPKAKPGPQLYERETQYTAQSNNPQLIDPNAYH